MHVLSLYNAVELYKRYFLAVFRALMIFEAQLPAWWSSTIAYRFDFIAWNDSSFQVIWVKFPLSFMFVSQELSETPVHEFDRC